MGDGKAVPRCFILVNLGHNFSVPLCLCGEIVMLRPNHRGTEENFSAIHYPHNLAKSQKKKTIIIVTSEESKPPSVPGDIWLSAIPELGWTTNFF
jgi:hypothetical protein